MTKPILPYTPARIAEVRSWVKTCATWLEARDIIAAKTGSHPDNVTKMNRRHSFWTAPTAAPEVSTTVEGDEMDASIQTSKAKTVEEVIALCKVDTQVWESKGFSVNKRANGFGWSARFSRRKEVGLETALATFTAAAANHAPRKWEIKPRKGERDGLYILNVQDLHMAKLAWGTETGGPDWDIYIAKQAYEKAVEELMTKAPLDTVDEVLLIVGSDMLQVDNDQSTTTAGTYVDSDSRLAKAFKMTADMLTVTIEKLAARFRVRCIVIPGNHDSITSMFLGHYVAAWFRSHTNVVVDSSPKSRKYYGYGKTLIAFDHGDATKLKDLPLVVMRENQSTISQYTYVEALCGHWHAEACQDTKGVVVRTAPALCAADKWHAKHGYVGNMRRSQGLLYRAKTGLEAIYYSTALD